MNNQMLDQWHEGRPTEPGTYLLRIPKGHDLDGVNLLLKLTNPDAYDWFLINAELDPETGWLLYKSPRDGSTRILSTIHVWWTKIDTDTSQATCD